MNEWKRERKKERKWERDKNEWMKEREKMNEWKKEKRKKEWTKERPFQNSLRTFMADVWRLLKLTSKQKLIQITNTKLCFCC